MTFRADAEASLERVYGSGAVFRERQLEAIESVALHRQRTLVVQRTGWGKSAVYFIATASVRRAADPSSPWPWLGPSEGVGMSSTALAMVALTTRMVPSEVKPLSAREFWPLMRRVDLGAALSTDAESLARDAALSLDETRRVLRLLDRATAVALAVERLEQSGIWTLTPDSEQYPAHLMERLQDAAPPLLHGVGDRAILGDAGLGIVGSRNVDHEGAEVAREAAAQAVSQGWPVISGAARGVDQQAMSAALERGGRVVGVLADALTRTAQSGVLRQAVHEERLLLLTPYAPTAGFSAANAMGRNKIIYGLSRRAFVVASDHDAGGTWAGAVEALRGKWTEVAVWRGPGEGPGNAPLVQRGATALSDLHDLVAGPLPTHAPAVQADQLSLEV